MEIKYIAFIGIAALIFLTLFFLYNSFSTKSVKFTKKEGELFLMPDLIFGKVDKPFTWVLKEENPDLLESNGYYMYGPIDGEYGVILLHPISKDLPRYLGTYIPLNDTKKSYVLQIKVGNIAGKSYISPPPITCNDNIFEIYLTDIFSSGDTYLIDRITVNTKDGWVYKEYSLDDYKGKKLYLQILSKAGGPCGDWEGEFGAISYLNIQEK
jgi:hypothetical protein